MRRLVAICAAASLAAGCWHSEERAFEPTLPPEPSTWPEYPDFSEHSCWARPQPANTGGIQSAPSFVSAENDPPRLPKELARRLLERFGDRRFVRGIEIGRPPPRREIRGFFPGKRPPGDALWAYIDAPSAVERPGRLSASEERAYRQARWEAALIGGALRDDFCDAGGPSLVGWSVSGHIRGVSAETFAFGQRFPNPSPQRFRSSVEQVGKEYGFRIVSLKLLRPRQLAPLLIVETRRDRKAFVRDVGEIVSLLNPSQARAATFEGFFFEAQDDKGVFVSVSSTQRGEVSGGQWSWSPQCYPYIHFGPQGGNRCRDERQSPSG